MMNEQQKKELCDHKRFCAALAKNQLLNLWEDIEEIYFDDQGELHKEDGPALVTSKGVKEWRQHGILHRIGGPAIEYNAGLYQRKEYYENGLLHRTDGPAVEYSGGIEEWYVNGQKIRKPKRKE